MEKIPTVFRRDPDDMKHVLDVVDPRCEWVLAGEGTATRKYDGTCVMLDDDGQWWARREVKAKKQPPNAFMPVSTDPDTGKTVGWEPISQSPFHKFWQEAMDDGERRHVGTYELCGPKINGNPEGYETHTLIPHADAAVIPPDPEHPARTFPLMRALVLGLRQDHGWEGIVFHHPDGRMAKLKGRDFW